MVVTTFIYMFLNYMYLNLYLLDHNVMYVHYEFMYAFNYNKYAGIHLFIYFYSVHWSTGRPSIIEEAYLLTKFSQLYEWPSIT